MKKTLIALFSLLSFSGIVNAANPYDNPDTLYVAQDGSAEFRNIDDAIEVCRAFMTYHKVIFVKKGVYKEKLIVPSWLTNIEICGEDRDNTIITYDDHANLRDQTRPGNAKIGTFRSYTLKVEGNDITLKNITIENASGRKGQACALHTEGDRLFFINCRFLGNQDTVYTGVGNTRMLFKDCYIEGTTDFIFGPSTAWFENCDIYCKVNSYITAASTPQDVEYGYVFNNCHISVASEVNQMYLGRPWRPYAYTLFMNCDIPAGFREAGWHNWGDKNNETTARYAEYNNRGEGASTAKRVNWVKILKKQEAAKITMETVLGKWSQQ